VLVRGAAEGALALSFLAAGLLFLSTSCRAAAATVDDGDEEEE
jgi:hypothetical protein